MDRKSRLMTKLHAKYKEERPRGSAPEMTEEERFWQEKEKAADHKINLHREPSKRSKKEDKQYDLLLDNQVDFVKSDLMGGVFDKVTKKMQKKTKKRGSSSSSGSESKSDSDSDLDEQKLGEVEKTLTPFERERLLIKQQKESLPMFTFRD